MILVTHSKKEFLKKTSFKKSEFTLFFIRMIHEIKSFKMSLRDKLVFFKKNVCFKKNVEFYIINFLSSEPGFSISY